MTRAQHEPTRQPKTAPNPTAPNRTASNPTAPNPTASNPPASNPTASNPTGPATQAAEPVDCDEAAFSRNDVVLRGRVAAPVDERQLPSGDTIITARLIVDRDAAALSRSSQRVDTIDCVAWLRKAQRSMRAWRAGEHVEVSGAIRRRFFRGADGPVSRVEVEIRSSRRLDKPQRRQKQA